MRHRQIRLINRIDVIGLLAVFFALFVAFCVLTGSSGHCGAGAGLPRVNHPIKMPEANREDALLVAIARDGKVFFALERVDPEGLPLKIREQLSYGSPAKVYIRADARARYGTVLEVLRAVRLGGIQSVAFLVEESKP